MYRYDICGRVSLSRSHGNINYISSKLMSSSLLMHTQVYFFVWNGTRDTGDDCREMEETNETLDITTSREFAIMKNIMFQIFSVNNLT